MDKGLYQAFKKINQKQQVKGWRNGFARIMSEFNMSYEELLRLPLPVYFFLLDVIVEQDKQYQKKAGFKK